MLKVQSGVRQTAKKLGHKPCNFQWYGSNCKDCGLNMKWNESGTQITGEMLEKECKA
jgi:hypothetical protein